MYTYGKNTKTMESKEANYGKVTLGYAKQKKITV